MKGFFFAIFAIAAFVVTFFAQIARLIIGTNLQPGTRQWDQLINNLRSKSEAARASLIPWDGKDLMPLLSFASLKARKGWLDAGTTKMGTINSIYQEPLVAIASLTQGKTKVAIARTDRQEFVFRMKEKEVEIWLNSQPYAVLSGGTLLASGKNSKLLAQMQASTDDRNLPVVINNNTALTLSNPALPATSPNPRALLVLRDLNPEEETAALALVILYQLKA